MALYIKNSDGKKSASLTMAYTGFVVTTSWLLFWIIGNTCGLHVPAFNETVALSYLTPLLGLYYGRRATDASSATTTESSAPKAEEGATPASTANEEQSASPAEEQAS